MLNDADQGRAKVTIEISFSFLAFQAQGGSIKRD